MGKSKLDWVQYALFAPIVAYAGYESYLRDNKPLLEKLRVLRLLGAKVCFEKKKKALEFEALLYLHTASLAVPFNETWFRIYAYLFWKYVPHGRHVLGERVRLDETERKLLDDLRRWIFKKQIKHLEEL